MSVTQNHWTVRQHQVYVLISVYINNFTSFGVVYKNGYSAN